ncbi:hypothetical protein [Ovoidimarina sediminis]|uniref:hypothetical protein n=1 Tax=Ovoidimarina sediminis TaxID=3079856 RepID=UPI0029112465|nr:hypothetical protein [Rhodophyticola sp. MJ-SS7]MDU8943276.1 hypothetical protein [Rhodophyticola sp. MJ-SS7]
MEVTAGSTLFVPDIEITPTPGETVVNVLYRWYETPTGQAEAVAGRDRIFSPGKAGTCRYEMLVLQSDGAEAIAVGPTVTVLARDITAPTLSGLATTPQNAAALLSWSTDTVGGTAYWSIDQTPSRTGAEIKGGIGAMSDSLAHTGIEAVSAAGVQPAIMATGLANDDQYFFHLVHEDAAANLSAPSDIAVVPAVAGGGIALAHIAAQSVASSSASIDIPVSLQAGTHLLAVNLKGVDTVLDVTVPGGTSTARLATVRNGTLLSVAVFEVEVPVGGATSVTVSRSGTNFLPALLTGYRITGGVFDADSGALNGSGNDTLDAALATTGGEAILGFAFGSGHTSEISAVSGWQGKEASQYLDSIRAEAFFATAAAGGAPESFAVTAPTAFKPWILAGFAYTTPTV